MTIYLWDDEKSDWGSHEWPCPEELAKRGIEIDETAQLGAGVRVGNGVVIGRSVVLGNGVRVNSFVKVAPRSVVPANQHLKDNGWR